MNTPTRDAAMAVCSNLSGLLEQMSARIHDDPELENCDQSAIMLGLLLVVCNFVMCDDNWQHRAALFDALKGCQWPESATVRTRVEELLDGVNIRSDYWNLN